MDISPQATARPDAESDLWLRLSHVKGLAKVLKKTTVVPYNRVLNMLCIVAGYSGYTDALHHPKAVDISLEEWRQRLSQQFDMLPDEIVSPEQFVDWHAKLFVRRGRSAAHDLDELHLRQVHAEGLPEDDSETEPIPSQIRHDQTIVDTIQQDRIARKSKRWPA